jgi:hypothetical protein
MPRLIVLQECFWLFYVLGEITDKHGVRVDPDTSVLTSKNTISCAGLRYDML